MRRFLWSYGNADNNQKSNKFLYQGTKQKTNSWGSIDEPNIYSSQSGNLSSGGSLNSLASLNFKGNAFDFDNAWSIRKNVPLPSTKKEANIPKNTTGTSYYSRHVNSVKGVGDNNQANDSGKSNKLANGNDNANGSRGWNFKKPEYSYGASTSTKRQMTESDDEFSSSAAKKGNFRKNEATKAFNQYPVIRGHTDFTTGGERKQSARTQKAKNIYNAYLKSAGLGQYVPEDLNSYKDENKSLSNCRQKSAGSDRSF